MKEIINKKIYVIVDEDGNILERFDRKVAANQNLARLKLNRYDKLKVVEI